MTRRTSQIVDSDWLLIFMLHDGKIASCRIFTDTAQFVAALRDRIIFP